MEPPLPSNPKPPTGGGEAEAAIAGTQGLESLPATLRHFHHYELCLREDGVTLHELGRGGMGVSYKARDVNLDTLVAIKVIHASLPQEAYVHARERFRREARAAAQLRHPNVACVFHFGETPTGECFYAMEFIEGETLADRVLRAGPLPVAQVVEIASQVAAALIAANERGLVHRDLKPANLMLVAAPSHRQSSRCDSPGNSPALAPPVLVKVIDFGLAKAASAGTAAEFEAPLTQEGGFLGTPAYASPEQGEGGEIDARSDIYSLGVTLWYLLIGKVPFTGRSFSEIYDLQLHRPLPVAQLSDSQVCAPLVQLLKSMLAANPAERPASPRALCDALECCRQEISAGPAAHPPSQEKSARLPTRRWRRGAVAAAFAAIALLLAGGGTATSLLLQRPAAAPEKSIAVLPLEDLSEDKSNAYFADGIQDDLLNSLAKIKELKVISRSSVMSYRNPAARDGERVVGLAPDLPLLQVEKSYADVWSRRDFAPLDAVLAAAPAGKDPDGEITLARWDAAMLGRDFAAAQAVASDGPETLVTHFWAVLPKSYLLGCIALAHGEAKRAQTFLETARPAMEIEAHNFPLDPFLQAQIRVIYSYLGRKDEALRQGRRAVELLPESKDAYFGPSFSGLLALIYARNGETDQAMTLIERLLRLPGALSQVFDGSITQSDLHLRWQWDPLRANPRFQALLAGPEPKTVYK